MKLLTKHLDESGLTYFKHMRRAIEISASSFLIFLALAVHGVFPFLFTKYGTEKLREIYKNYL